MIVDLAKFDDNRIKSLDSILERLKSSPDSVVTFTEPDVTLFKYMQGSTDILNRLGFIRRFASTTDQIVLTLTDKGKIFVETNSFHLIKQNEEKRKRHECEKIEQDRTQHQVNKNALRAAKREPWLIALSVISTLLAIYLGIFK